MTRTRGEGGAVLGSVARLAVVLAAAVTSLALATSMMAASVSGCNEAVCASIVSKCMLLQSCKCELQPDCTCCKVDRNNNVLYELSNDLSCRDVSSAWTISTASAAPVWICVQNPMSPYMNFPESLTWRYFQC